ncbi:MAG: glycosyltransferase family 4 protein, partial [Leptolyngbya sp. SIO4C5]|nr:glycosyltransferase family 4 protein [Leptolyngbya sp. SIO4C5]
MFGQYRYQLDNLPEAAQQVRSQLSSLPQALKLCIITQFYPPDYAATGQLIEDLAQNLGQFNIAVEVFTGQPGYAFDQISAPAVERSERLVVKRSPIARLWFNRIRGKAIGGLLFCCHAIFYLLRAARRHDVLLVTTAPPFLPLLGYLAQRYLGLPYVCLLYDLYPDIAIASQVIPAHHWLARSWRRVNYKIWQRSQAIIVLSPAMKQRIVDYHPELATKVSVIHNWADPEQIVPIAKDRNWFAWKHNLVEPFTVLYSGNMGRCHDLETVMKAATYLRHKPIQFVFIGGGVQRHQCQEKAQSLGLTNCLFLPYQTRDTLPYSLTACDLSLVTIRSGFEGLVAPSKFYSSLAAGRPIAVISEKNSSLGQLVKKTGCGAVFEPGDAKALAKFIRYLSLDASAAQQMGKRGRFCFEKSFT